MKRREWLIYSGVGLMAIGLAACGRAERSESRLPLLKLESSAFAAEGKIPAQYTCDGADGSPPLQWADPPAGTQSFVLLLEDPDAPNGTFTHWVLYDLPADTRQLPEQVAPQPLLNTGGTQGKSDFDRYGYGGPCPPAGTHRYLFKLYALDTILDLPPGATAAEVKAAMQPHILAEGQLMGRYGRS